MTEKSNKKRADKIDQFVGDKIRQRRVMLGMTQQQLADAIGVTYQQAHKYEQGINRISASRLYQIGKVLNATVDKFFDGYDEGVKVDNTPRQRLGLELSRHFSLIRNERHQEAIANLAKALTNES